MRRFTCLHSMGELVVVLPLFHMGWRGDPYGVVYFVRPGFIVIFSFMFTLWRGAGSGGTFVVGCFVLLLWCGGSGVCSALGSCTGGGDGYFVTGMLNMSSNLFSSAVYFSPSCGMGLDGAGFWRTYVISDAVCVTASSGYRLRNLFWTGKSYVTLDTSSNAVLGMYDVRHR